MFCISTLPGYPTNSTHALQDSGWSYGLEVQPLNSLLLMGLNLNFTVKLF